MTRAQLKERIKKRDNLSSKEVCELIDEIFDTYLLDLTSSEILNLKNRVGKLEMEVEEVRRDNLRMRDELENLVKFVRGSR